ncbi:MAG: hypothetical protein WBK91_08385 [Alphaproteobacteria bacterium]
MVQSLKDGFRQKFLGGLDLFFLFGRGMAAFDGTRVAALRSLAIPIGILLFNLVYHSFWPYPPKGMEVGYSSRQIMGTVVVHTLLGFGLTTAFSWLVLCLLGKKERFWLLFTATNWTGLAGSVVTFPLSIMATLALAPREVMDRVFVILMLYTLFVAACIVQRGLGVNWPLAIGIAIGAFCINNELWHVVYAVQGIPIPW